MQDPRSVRPIRASANRLPRRSFSTLVAVVGLLLAAPAAEAEIQVKTLEDGTHLIFNENKTQKARRTSTQLVPIPASSGLETLIRAHALREGLSPRLVQALVQVESGYNAKALSSKGAIGLMQLMPDTAKDLGVDDPWNPDENIRGGTRYLRMQLDTFGGELALALAAYNAGPTAVKNYGGIPPYAETQRYVQKVLGLYHRNPPALLREHARTQGKLYREQQQVSAQAAAQGGKVYVTRDANNAIIFTTIPPGQR